MRWIAKTVVVILMAAAMAGCGFPQPMAPQAEPVVQRGGDLGGGDATYLAKTAIREETSPEADNAVDAALEWAKRYSIASAELQKLQKEHRQLLKDNQDYRHETTRLKVELNRAEKELSEANAMLLDMRDDLEKWKADVLGFRREMRQAQEAQLNALARILTLIGGAVETPPPAAAAAAPAMENRDVAKR